MLLSKDLNEEGKVSMRKLRIQQKKTQLEEKTNEREKNYLNNRFRMVNL